MPILIQIIRPVSVAILIIGFILLFGAGGLNGLPVDIINLIVAIIMIVAGFSGLKYVATVKNKDVGKVNRARRKISVKTLRMVGLLLIVLGVLLLLGNIYTTRYYLELVFIRVNDMPGMLDNMVKYKHVFGQMLVSLMIVVAGIFLRRSQVVKESDPFRTD